MTRVLSAICLVLGAGLCGSTGANIAAGIPVQGDSFMFGVGAMLLMLGWVLRKT